MIGYKTILNKFKKIEIRSRTFSDHKENETRNQPQGKNSKNSNIWRLNSMLLNNEWAKNEIKEEIREVWETKNISSQHYKTCGTQQRQS